MLEETALCQFTGTNSYYRHWLSRFVYTDGVKYVADNGSSHWLIDAIASYQPQLLKEPTLQEFQHWKLMVNADQKATLVCERDTDDVVVTQEISFTDFPLSEIRFYLVMGVLMLPSEY